MISDDTTDDPDSYDEDVTIAYLAEKEGEHRQYLNRFFAFLEEWTKANYKPVGP